MKSVLYLKYVKKFIHTSTINLLKYYTAVNQATTLKAFIFKSSSLQRFNYLLKEISDF